MPIYNNINGVWKEVDTSHVNVGGINKIVEAVFVNVLGIWKEVDIGGKDIFIITPDVTVADMQALIDTHTDGLVMMFETGNYNWDNSLTIKYSNTYLIGKMNSNIIWNGTSSGGKMIETVSTGLTNIYIKGLSFNAGSIASDKPWVNGIFMDNVGAGVSSGEINKGYDSSKVGSTGGVNKHGFAILDCKFIDFDDYWSKTIEVNNCGNSVVERVVIDKGGSGISIDSSTNINVKNCRIRYCRAFSAGVYIKSSNKVVVEGCLLRGNMRGVGVVTSSNCTVDSNIFEFNDENDILVDGNAIGNMISSNHSLVDKAIYASQISIDVRGLSRGNIIIGNVIQSPVTGIRNTSATYNYFCGNIVLNATTYLSITGTGTQNNYNRSITG